MSKTIFKANISQEPGKDPVIELLEGDVEVKISGDGVGKYLIEYRDLPAPTEFSKKDMVDFALYVANVPPSPYKTVLELFDIWVTKHY